VPVVIAMLRGVNVGGHHKIKMDVLRTLCESIGLENPQTFIQSGNIVFKTKERNLKKVARLIEDAIEGEVEFRPDVILRTTPELKNAIAKNPFAKRRDLNPAKLLVNFFAEEPDAKAKDQVLKIKADGEEMRINGRELYIYFPDGMGRSKLPLPKIGTILGSTSTGRNLNTVNKLLEMAQSLEG